MGGLGGFIELRASRAGPWASGLRLGCVLGAFWRVSVNNVQVPLLVAQAS